FHDVCERGDAGVFAHGEDQSVVLWIVTEATQERISPTGEQMLSLARPFQRHIERRRDAEIDLTAGDRIDVVAKPGAGQDPKARARLRFEAIVCGEHADEGVEVRHAPVAHHLEFDARPKLVGHDLYSSSTSTAPSFTVTGKRRTVRMLCPLGVLPVR